MKLRLLAMIVSASCALALGACSSETDDGDGTPGSGGSGATGADGGAGVGATGADGGAGVGATGGGGAGTGGAGECIGCATYITDCAIQDPEPYCETAEFCAGSSDIFDALGACICTECAEDCSASCNLGGADTADCGTCQAGAAQGACSTEFADCSGDTPDI